MSITSIASVVNNAIAFNLNPNNRSQTSVDDAAVIYVSEARIASVFSILQSRMVNYLLVGGVAMLVYVEGRNTQDIDLLLDPSELSRIPELTILSRDRNFARADFNGLQIDLLLTTNPLFQYAFEHYGSIKQVGDIEIDCIQPEGLILLKLYALPSLYRQGSLQRANLYESDITALLIEFPHIEGRLEHLFVRLSNSLISSDVKEVREIVGDICRKISRMRR
jgi:hypothetical protein